MQREHHVRDALWAFYARRWQALPPLSDSLLVRCSLASLWAGLAVSCRLAGPLDTLTHRLHWSLSEIALVPHLSAAWAADLRCSTGRRVTHTIETDADTGMLSTVFFLERDGR